MIPGLDGTGNLFEPLINTIHKTFQILVVKYPNETSSALVDIVHFIRSQIPADRQVILIAESFGGPIAIKLLADGLRVKACILCATFSSAPRVRLLHLLKLLPIKILPKLYIPSIIANRVFLGKTSKLSTIKLLRKTIRSIEPRILESRINILSELDLLTELKLLPQIPFLFIQPTSDLLVPPESTNSFQEYLERIKFQKIEGGHFILQSNPEDCWVAINTFLEGLKPSHPISPCKENQRL